MKNNECDVSNDQEMATKEIISRRVEPTPWPRSENSNRSTDELTTEGRK
ncbi:MAG: hypothetical protein PF638_02095 [Candidatus Delongbacteria bacterium]|jgi:hypothetical protein|nr:hypothetical protein [Candidatus Delongbacteria bacterium]